jgi:hypothetical protein
MAFLTLKCLITKIYAGVRVLLFSEFGKFEEVSAFKFCQKPFF